MMSKQKDILDFYDYLHSLKKLRRRGWLLRGVSEVDCESVAGHIFSVSWLALCFLKDFPHLDENKVLKMCLIHDLGESLIGDITPVDGVSQADKSKMEYEAIKKISEIWDIDVNLWKEFEDNQTAEAIFVNDIDKLDLLLQAVKYKDKLGEKASEFIESALDSIQNEKLLDIARGIKN